MPAPNTLIAATVEHLRRFAPFNMMDPSNLAWLAERLKLGYYAKGEVVLSPESGQAHTFFIIKQGVINGEQDVVRAQDDAAWLELHEGECFPLGALLSKRPVNSTYKAGIDTFCYELSLDDFHETLRKCPAFHDFCTHRLANLLEQSKQVIQAQYTKTSSEQQSMTSPLSAIIRREPVSCSPDTPTRQVLETMNSLGIGSMVAVDAEKRPLGIFTLHDVLKRIVLPGLDLSAPFKTVMSPDPVTLPPHALAYEAALVMARHGFRHILVEENGRLAGLVSEKDLFGLQRVGLRQLSSVIRKAPDLETLKHSARDIRQLAQNMLAQGVTAEQLTQIISTLNDLLTARILELELESTPEAKTIDFCWLALGSEGRMEQTLNTDQDNGIIFRIQEGKSADDMRATLLPFAKRINQALAECGFPLCSGEVMASNPKWCLSLSEWKECFDKWIYHGAPVDLLNSTIFFDFRALFGMEHLAEELRTWLVEQAQQNSRFLHQLAVNALRNKPPLGIVRDFVTGDGHTIDLKVNGITPFVDAARIYSLARGVPATNTLQRLREAGARMALDEQDIDAYCDAFLYIQLLRLRLHHEQEQSGQELSNKVDPDTLNPLDSRILRESFRQARKLQAKLALDYQA
jgi:CBS domain-containing protein